MTIRQALMTGRRTLRDFYDLFGGPIIPLAVAAVAVPITLGALSRTLHENVTYTNIGTITAAVSERISHTTIHRVREPRQDLVNDYGFLWADFLADLSDDYTQIRTYPHTHYTTIRYIEAETEAGTCRDGLFPWGKLLENGTPVEVTTHERWEIRYDGSAFSENRQEVGRKMESEYCTIKKLELIANG